MSHICLESRNYRYPKLLRLVSRHPKVLYCKGRFKKGMFDNCLSVIGSRYMSSYGRDVIKHLFKSLNKNITIVSGFMKGVDTFAHEQAIEFGLKTIAVIPCGIDYIYPNDQMSLYLKILSSGGLVLSEYDNNFGPEIWMYPRRNKIVAGISKATLVIEASIGSGSIMTADIANSFGRRVFVIPGSIFSILSKGKVEISNKYAISIDSIDKVNVFMSSLSIFD